MSGDESEMNISRRREANFLRRTGLKPWRTTKRGRRRRVRCGTCSGIRISDNGYATTYDRVIQNIRSSVRGIIAMAGDLSEAEEERLAQVLERLSKAIEAQIRPTDLDVALQETTGTDAVASPRLALPLHNALQQAQSDGRTADQAMMTRLTQIKVADGQKTYLSTLEGGTQGLIKTGTILLLRHLQDLADVGTAADVSDDAKEDQLRIFIGSKRIKPEDYWTSHAKPAMVLAWFRVAYITMLRSVTTVTSTSAPDVFKALGQALLSALQSKQTTQRLAYWRDIHMMHKDVHRDGEAKGLSTNERYTALLREVSVAYSAGSEDPPPEPHCPASTFSDLPPLSKTTAAGIFQSGGNGDGGGGSGGGGGVAASARKPTRCPRCRSNRHTSTADCPLSPPPADKAAAAIMKSDSSKFCLGKDPAKDSIGSDWDVAFKISCWKCNRWGHGTYNCPK